MAEVYNKIERMSIKSFEIIPSATCNPALYINPDIIFVYNHLRQFVQSRAESLDPKTEQAAEMLHHSSGSHIIKT